MSITAPMVSIITSIMIIATCGCQCGTKLPGLLETLLLQQERKALPDRTIYQQLMWHMAYLPLRSPTYSAQLPVFFSDHISFRLLWRILISVPSSRHCEHDTVKKHVGIVFISRQSWASFSAGCSGSNVWIVNWRNFGLYICLCWKNRGLSQRSTLD